MFKGNLKLTGVFILIFLFQMIPDVVISKEINLYVTNFYYLPGSTITPRIESYIRESLLQALQQNFESEIDIRCDTLAVTSLTTNKDSVKKKALNNNATFVLTGQLDIIGETSWILTFSVLDVKYSENDTIFNPDARQYKMDGSLRDLLASGVIDNIAQKISLYLLRKSQTNSWWKSPRFLIAGSMIGASLISFLIYEYTTPNTDKKEEKPDLPTAPDPPDSNRK